MPVRVDLALGKGSAQRYGHERQMLAKRLNPGFQPTIRDKPLRQGWSQTVIASGMALHIR